MKTIVALVFPDLPRPEVFILGAGFSRCLSRAMPLTDSLGNECVECAGLAGHRLVPRDGFSNGRFEAWLSRMAEAQPDLTDIENAEREQMFLEVTQALHYVLRQHSPVR